jgi:hypothetical protein
MKSSDPSSLQNLNDIVLPAAESWWPLAVGWYVLLGLLLAGLAWYGYKSVQRWYLNRYRRAALHELQLLSVSIQNPVKRDASLRQIPTLLKRTALSVYPRSQVASLTGKDWYRFLNSKLSPPLFTQETAGILEHIAYSTGDLNSVDTLAATKLLEASQYWLKHHQAAESPRNSRET